MALNNGSLSSELKEVYRKYFEEGAGDPEVGLSFVQPLLEKYPYYTEALLFKARMLLARGQYEEAESAIRELKGIDHWNKSYIYDEAELIYRKNKKAAVDFICAQVRDVADDIFDGISNFLLAVEEGERNEVRRRVVAALTERVAQESPSNTSQED